MTMLKIMSFFKVLQLTDVIGVAINLIYAAQVIEC